MRNLRLVSAREFLERVRTKSFVIGTILFPLFVAGVMILPRMLERGGSERRIAVVNEAAPQIGATLVALLTAPPERDEGNTYVVDEVAGPIDAVRDELVARVQAEELDGYVVIPADVLDTNEITYRARNIGSFTVLGEVRRAGSRAVQVERLRLAGLEVTEVAALLRPVDIREARITERGEEGGDAISTFYVAYVLAFLIYFMTAFYGMSVMRSVLEEKTSRIAEVLVSSLSAVHLMIGKILGVGASALLQVGIWAVLILVLATQTSFLTDRLGIPAEVLAQLSIPLGVASLLIVFFVLGFLLFAALFAALGAAVTTEQEAQSLQMVVLLPLFIPMLFMLPITMEPLGGVARTLGLLPLTSAITMPMRLAATRVPTAEIVASLLLLVLSIVVVGWVAGKIYRIGILATGKRPSLKELGRWVRAA